MKRWGALICMAGLFLCTQAQADDPINYAAGSTLDANAQAHGWKRYSAQCDSQPDPLCIVKFTSRHRRGCLRRYHLNEDGQWGIRPSTRPFCRKKPYKNQSIPNWLWSVQ